LEIPKFTLAAAAVQSSAWMDRGMVVEVVADIADTKEVSRQAQPLELVLGHTEIVVLGLIKVETMALLSLLQIPPTYTPPT